MADPRLPARGRAGWAWFLAIGSLVVIASPLVPSELHDLVYVLFGPIAAVAIIVGARLHRPVRPQPWYLLAAGQLVWGIADMVAAADAMQVDGPTFPNASDPLYLAGYALAAVGLALLIPGRSARTDMAGNLDTAILTTALGLLSWVVLARPIAELQSDSPWAAGIGMAYPVADIVLVALLLRLIAVPGSRTRSFRFLAYGLLLLIVADTLASAAKLVTWTSSEQFDMLWLASYVLLGTAGLHPSMRSVSDSSKIEGYRPLTFARSAALTAAVLVAPAVLVVQTLARSATSVWGIALGSALTSVLVMARMTLAVRQMERLHEEREIARAALAHQAAHDSLTGLPNRATALGLVTSALHRARDGHSSFAVLFLDLDGFKQVNDTLGHHAGDEVLTICARRMEAAIRGGDAVARLGGDEFVVLLDPLDGELSAVTVARRLVDKLAEPMSLSSSLTAQIGASVGVRVFDGADNDDVELLLKQADQAAYRAKASGRGTVQVFEPSSSGELERSEALRGAARSAVAEGAAVVTGVPVVRLVDRVVVGHLLDYAIRGPNGLTIGRADLLASAGAVAEVCALDGWMLRHAGKAFEIDPGGFVGIAVTSRHAPRGRLLEDVLAALEAGALRASGLVLVVTWAEVGDPRLAAVLQRVRTFGVRVFATNVVPSEVTSRSDAPPIDFISVAVEHATDEATAEAAALVEWARRHDRTVVGAGLADHATAELAAESGCQLGTGQLFELPLSFAQQSAVGL